MEKQLAAIPKAVRRYFCRIMHAVVTNWPLSCHEGINGRIWFWMLPWAGEWAYYWSEPPEYRRQLDLLNTLIERKEEAA